MTRLALGLLIWAGAATAAGALAKARGGELKVPLGRLSRYALATQQRVKGELLCTKDPQGNWTQLRPGDPVLASWDRTEIGTVESVGPIHADGTAPLATPVFSVEIALDPELEPDALVSAPIRYETSAGDLQWVFDTVLPPEKRELIRTELSTWAKEHQDEIAQVIRPIGEDVLEHTMNVLDMNLAPALKNHEKEVQAVLDKHRDALKEELLPVLKSQLGPTVKARAKPILTKIGRELWNELPMWELSWSAFRDKLPWQSKNYVDEWWNQFLENKAMPIVKAHEDELVKMGEELVQEAIRDPKVRAAFGEATRRLAKDPDFKKVVRVIVEDALVRPFDAPALISKLFADEGHRNRVASLQASLTPVLKKIARVVAMDERTNGLSPDLARVLRRMLFNKDARWVSLATTGPVRRHASGGTSQ